MILDAIVGTERFKCFQLLAAFIVSFIAVMGVFGSQEYLPINLGTPGLVSFCNSFALDPLLQRNHNLLWI